VYNNNAIRIFAAEFGRGMFSLLGTSPPMLNFVLAAFGAGASSSVAALRPFAKCIMWNLERYPSWLEKVEKYWRIGCIKLMV
jgi:hypothetical protein